MIAYTGFVLVLDFDSPKMWEHGYPIVPRNVEVRVCLWKITPMSGQNRRTTDYSRWALSDDGYKSGVGVNSMSSRQR